jgi:hypothetical protein
MKMARPPSAMNGPTNTQTTALRSERLHEEERTEPASLPYHIRHRRLVALLTLVHLLNSRKHPP